MKPKKKNEIDFNSELKRQWYKTGAYAFISFDEFVNTVIDSWFIKTSKEYNQQIRMQ